MPVWKGQVAIQERDGASGPWGAHVCPGANSMEVALQAIRTILVDSTEPPDMTYWHARVMWCSGGLILAMILEWKEGLV